MSWIAWPNGARCAAAITFDMDADSLIHIAAEDGWRRAYPVSMGRYGPTVAIPRIVETYRRLGLKQSFFIPGWCLETYPQAVETILKGGHEIGCHGWIHENPLKRTRAEQAGDLDRSLDAFDRIVGRRPTGYRAPVYQVTEHTVVGLHVAQMTSPDAMRQCYELVTTGPAEIMGLSDYGLRPGALASLIVLDAADPIEAIRRRPQRLAVISKGRVVARTRSAETRLFLP